MVHLVKNVVMKVEIFFKSGAATEKHRFVLGSGTEITFELLKDRIRSRISPANQTIFYLSYQDNEGEIVQLRDDGDLEDALLFQKLNPFRVFLTLPEPDVSKREAAARETPSLGAASPPTGKSAGDVAGAAPAVIEEIFKNVRKVVKKSEDRAIDVAHIVDSVSAMLVNSINGPATELLSGVLNKPSSSAEAETKSSGPEGTVTAQHVPPTEPDVEVNGVKKTDTGKEPLPNEGGEDDFPARVFHSRVQCDGCGMLPIVGPRFKSTVKDDYDLCHACHGRADDKQSYSRIDRPLFKPRHALWGHRHVRRGCAPPVGLFGGRPFVPAGQRGPPPPMGWTGGCEAGNARSSLPPMGLHGDSAGAKAPQPPMAPVYGPFADSESQQRFRDLGMWGANFYSKLDSRFVCDVSIFDGTELAPGTPFTKIWRMRNNGNTNWPPGTALTHIGGDTLTNVSTVTLPLPPHGVGVDEEYDMAVDAIAPQLPGRYVSHWRLVAPNGPKFGHRVWMLIQVVPKGEISPQEAMLLKKADEAESSAPVLQQPAIDVSEATEHTAPATGPLPAEFFGSATGSTSSSMLLVPPPPTPPALEKGISVQEVVKHAPTDVTGILSEAAQYLSQVAARERSPVSESEALAPAENAEKPKSGVVSFREESMGTKKTTSKAEDSDDGAASSTNKEKVDQVDVSGSDTPTKTENTSVGGFALLDAPTPPEDITYPEVTPSIPSPPTTVGKEVVSERLDDAVQLGTPQNPSGVHASALMQLKAMGFHDAVLNVELLEKNHGDIQSTVDDLVAAEEWDPMLEELEEMGFTDVEVNRRLMFKNKGSVKQVVKELVEMYTSGNATLSK